MKKRGYYVMLAFSIVSYTSLGNAKERTITVKNTITRPMLGYRYGITYYPTNFSCRINNVTVEPGSSVQVPLTSNTVTIDYSYAFLSGSYKGKKEVTFVVDDNQNDYNLSFSWNDPARLKLSGAQIREVKRVN